MTQAVETALITLFGAVALFTISELLRGLIIRPILDLRSHTGVIVDKVIYFAGQLTSGVRVPADKEQLIREQLRTISTQLRAKEQMLPVYSLWAYLGLVPTAPAIDDAAKDLMGLSNSFEVSMAGSINYRDQSEWTYSADPRVTVPLIQDLQKSLRLKTEIVPVIKDDQADASVGSSRRKPKKKR